MRLSGNTAHLLRYRFSADVSRFLANVIDRLLRLSWWDWFDQKIEAFLPLMFGDWTRPFLDYAEAKKRRGFPPAHSLASAMSW